jgi:hypothetical protein
MPGVKGKSGRRPESKLRRFHELIDNCWTPEMRHQVLNELIDDCSSKVFQERHESRKLLFAYTFGKPTEHVKHEILDPKKLANETADDLRAEYPQLTDEQIQTVIIATFGDVTEHGQIG